jgi:hypothetical protein
MTLRRIVLAHLDYALRRFDPVGAAKAGSMEK